MRKKKETPKAKPIELTPEQYASHLFSTMLDKSGSGSPHWESIRAKAEPLVRQLIALNDEMKGGGYVITGIEKIVNGKTKVILPKHERVRLAREKLWGCTAGDCKKGDCVWRTHDYDNPVEDVEASNCETVDDVRTDCVVVETSIWGQRGLKKVSNDEIVLRAPKELVEAWHKQRTLSPSDFADYHKFQQELYMMEKNLFSDEYWLNKADELGI